MRQTTDDEPDLLSIWLAGGVGFVLMWGLLVLVLGIAR